MTFTFFQCSLEWKADPEMIESIFYVFLLNCSSTCRNWVWRKRKELWIQLTTVCVVSQYFLLGTKLLSVFLFHWIVTLTGKMLSPCYLRCLRTSWKKLLSAFAPSIRVELWRNPERTIYELLISWSSFSPFPSVASYSPTFKVIIYWRLFVNMNTQNFENNESVYMHCGGRGVWERSNPLVKEVLI